MSENGRKWYQDLDAESIGELVKLIAAAKPIAELVADTLHAYSPTFKKVVEPLQDWYVSRRVKAIKAYEEAGLTKDQAVLLTISSAHSWKQAIADTRMTAKK